MNMQAQQCPLLDRTGTVQPGVLDPAQPIAGGGRGKSGVYPCTSMIMLLAMDYLQFFGPNSVPLHDPVKADMGVTRSRIWLMRDSDQPINPAPMSCCMRIDVKAPSEPVPRCLESAAYPLLLFAVL